MRFLIGIALLLVVASPAQAQDVLEHAGETLKLDPVYVAPDAEVDISDSEADDLRSQITDERAGPLFIAVLPESADDETGDEPVAALRQIADTVAEPGVYAAVIGRSFRAGATDSLSGGRAGLLAQEAFNSKRDDGPYAVLSDFVRRVGDARSGSGSDSGVGASGGAGDGDDDNGGGFGWLLLALIAVPVGLFALAGRRRRRREQAAEFERVRKLARDDVIGLGEEIRALDLDMEMPGVDAEGKQYYGEAVQSYQQAEQALEGARRPEDLQPVSEQLEAGRWAMEAARARIAGAPVPERRPPCFFDPRHGPSVTDVEWAPPGGQPRPVPACAADATRIADGHDPDARHVSVNGREVPYWEAGPAYGPFAGGFFAGGLVPGLLVGSMLGGGFGMFGGEGEAAAGAGDFGGGDFDDFGGGDFGGGDFGGGDFGGGDF